MAYTPKQDEIRSEVYIACTHLSSICSAKYIVVNVLFYVKKAEDYTHFWPEKKPFYIYDLVLLYKKPQMCPVCVWVAADHK